ncbi:MAG: glycine cleavage system protein GcvH [Betaproteobacteria bacterium]|nr:glycine cleavage system protein GcvH [Betaproteobacteria bacterium]
MDTPASLRYTDSHEWVRTDADGCVTIGITAHAQDQLGELVYVELPAIGRGLNRGEAFAVVESTKAASDVYAPIDGEVVEVNSALADTPQSVNSSPYDAGWLIRVRPATPSQIDSLLSAEAYLAGPGAP